MSRADEVATLVRERGARIVGISGPDCAGKSTLAAEVAALLPGAVVIAGDDFTRPAEERHARPYDESFDYTRLFEHVPADTIAIVEGCFLFTRELAPRFDLRVWIDVPPETVLERALVRDAELMGGEDEVRRRYAARYLPGQALHVERDDPVAQADLVLRG